MDFHSLVEDLSCELLQKRFESCWFPICKDCPNDGECTSLLLFVETGELTPAIVQETNERIAP